MQESKIGLRQRRRARRSGKSAAYNAIRVSKSAQEAIARGRRMLEANYSSGLLLTVAIQVLIWVIQYLFANMSEGNPLPALPPNWESLADPQ